MSAVRGHRRHPAVSFEATRAAGEAQARLGPSSWPARACHALLRRLPVGVAPRFGAALSRLARFLARRRVYARRIAFNLAALAPGAPLAPAELDRRVGRWWANAGAVLAEYATVDRLLPAARLSVEGLEAVAPLLPRDGPAVFVAVHTGPFELCFVAVLQGLGREAVGTWQPEPGHMANRLLWRLRRRYGMHLFPPGKRSARHLYRCVVEAGFDAVLFVDEVRERQVHLPAFGRPLPTRGNAVVAAKLALATGAPLVPVHVLREGSGARYRLVLGAPLAFDRTAPDAVARAVAAMEAVFAPVVRAHLEDWYMLAELRLPGFVAFPGHDAAGAGPPAQ